MKILNVVHVVANGRQYKFEGKDIDYVDVYNHDRLLYIKMKDESIITFPFENLICFECNYMEEEK